MYLFKILSILIIFILTILSGIYPFLKKIKAKPFAAINISEPFAAGVFLGAGMLHMLADANNDFYQLKFEYPMALLIASVVFLFLLLLDHVAREVYHKSSDSNKVFAVLAVLILSIHSFLEGAALGLTTSDAVTLILLVAVIAHKWAASFALSVQINKTNFSFKSSFILFLIFACMTPLGIIIGSQVETHLENLPLMEPIFVSFAAGSFIYLGTLHGLERATLVQKCCNIKGFTFMLIGFFIMALLAIIA